MDTIDEFNDIFDRLSAELVTDDPVPALQFAESPLEPREGKSQRNPADFFVNRSDVYSG